jgi:hypothetical protein
MTPRNSRAAEPTQHMPSPPVLRDFLVRALIALEQAESAVALCRIRLEQALQQPLEQAVPAAPKRNQRKAKLPTR